jgi:Tol biopolymer transport system component
LPGFDDRLKQHLERAAPPADPSGAVDRILEKKLRRRLVRRFQAAGLAVAVVAATIGGTFALYQAFRPDEHRPPRPGQGPLRGNGKIAFVRTVRGSEAIYSINPDGSDLMALTTETEASRSPAWVPDGQKVAFVKTGIALEGQDIFVMNSDGSQKTNLTKTPGVHERDPAWSPDMSRIAFVSNKELSNEIWVMDSDGSNPKRLTGVLGSGVAHPAWSQDGKRIAFTTPDSAATGSIYVMNADGSAIQKIYTDEQNTRIGPSSWSPDGKKIAFTRWTDGVGGNVYTIDPDGTGLTPLTDDDVSSDPAWSPDGRRLVYAREDGLYLMDADGNSKVKVPGTLKGASTPSWQPAATSFPGPAPLQPPTPSPLAPECDASNVIGDFEGDQAPDLAVVAKTECLTEPTDHYNTEYALHVQWFAPEGGHPAEGIAPLPDCRKVCRAQAAADLNGDGIDEFILQVDAGASTDFIQIYELPASETFGRPSIVAPPGSPPRWPPGEPAEFALYGSVTHYDALGCDLINNQVIVQSAALDSDQRRWSVHESILRFDPTDGEPFGQFTVVSERDYTEPAEENIGPGDQFEPGDPCWIATG